MDLKNERAKVLCYDLEISPRLGWYYQTYETTPIREEQPPILLSIAWKWLEEKEAHCLTLRDRSLVDPLNDKLLVDELWHLLDKCDIALGHNVKAFDSKMANYFFVKHNMAPPSPYKQIDTLQAARKYFKFGQNKLDYLSQLLGDEGKTKQTYADCWYELLYGTKKEQKIASRTMAQYNRNDVLITEKLYKKLLPWMDNHPNMSLYGGLDVCPRCGQNKGFRVKAYRRTGTQINGIQYCCKNCGAYVTRKLDKEERDALKEEGKLTSTFRNLAP